MPDELEFEKPLLELENRIAELRASEDSLAARDEIAKLEERLARQQQRVYSGLTAWQRTQIARHPKRPHTLDLVNLLLEDWVELHGDRRLRRRQGDRGRHRHLRRRAGGGDRPPEGAGHPREHRPQLRHAASRGLPQGAPPDAAGRQVRQADHHAHRHAGRLPGPGRRGARAGRGHRAEPARDGGAAHAGDLRGHRGGRQRRRARARRRQPGADARVLDLLGDLAGGLRGHPVGRGRRRPPRRPS